jgi:MOSC domain-containing protein YiiM
MDHRPAEAGHSEGHTTEVMVESHDGGETGMAQTIGRVASINTSRGGVPKQPVFEALVTADGIDGDRQRDRRFHGGPDRAVVLFSLDVIEALRAEGHSIATGTTGENLTLSGIAWASLVPGTELTIGGARLRITTYASPCYKIAGSFADGDQTRLSQKSHPGWSRVCARVVTEGLVRVGDAIQLVSGESLA